MTTLRAIVVSGKSNRREREDDSWFHGVLLCTAAHGSSADTIGRGSAAHIPVVEDFF